MKNSTSNVIVTVTSGGFKTGDQILKSSNTAISANITSTVVVSGTPITNFTFEDEINSNQF